MYLSDGSSHISVRLCQDSRGVQGVWRRKYICGPLQTPFTFMVCAYRGGGDLLCCLKNICKNVY